MANGIPNDRQEFSQWLCQQKLLLRISVGLLLMCILQVAGYLIWCALKCSKCCLIQHKINLEEINWFSETQITYPMTVYCCNADWCSELMMNFVNMFVDWPMMQKAMREVEINFKSEIHNGKIPHHFVEGINCRHTWNFKKNCQIVKKHSYGNWDDKFIEHSSFRYFDELRRINLLFWFGLSFIFFERLRKCSCEEENRETKDPIYCSHVGSSNPDSEIEFIVVSCWELFVAIAIKNIWNCKLYYLSGKIETKLLTTTHLFLLSTE